MKSLIGSRADWVILLFVRGFTNAVLKSEDQGLSE
jgi:hypothetical protein